MTRRGLVRPVAGTDEDEPGLFGAVVEQGAYGGPHTVWTVPSAAEARDEAIERVERDAWSADRDLIDQAITTVAGRGTPFSANEVRELLPVSVKRSLIGARFLAAAKAGWLVRIGYEPSTDPGTHSSPVAVWRSR